VQLRSVNDMEEPTRTRFGTEICECSIEAGTSKDEVKAALPPNQP